jgi:hypothetical protein
MISSIENTAPPHNAPKKKNTSSLSNTQTSGTIKISRSNAIKILSSVPIIISFIIMVQIYKIVFEKTKLFLMNFLVNFCCWDCWGKL